MDTMLVQIFEMVLKLNKLDNLDVFFSVVAHRSEIEIRIYEGGWYKGKHSDITLDAYYSEANLGFGRMTLGYILEKLCAVYERGLEDVD